MASLINRLMRRKSRPDALQRANEFYVQGLESAAQQDYEHAVRLFDNAIVANPTHAEACYKRGNMLKNLGRFVEARESYNAAIAIRHDYAHAYCNRGVVEQTLGLFADALSSYDHAIALDPSDAMAHFNRALLLQEFSRWTDVLESYERAIAIDPCFADAQYNRSLALLSCGDFEQGWSGYEWRWQHTRRLSFGELREFVQPLWLGKQSIAGKRLLLHSEGGLGDTLQFCRYASLAAAAGATVYLEVQPTLVNLLTGLEGVSMVLAAGTTLPNFDFHCPLMSLPLAFKTTLDTVPAGLQYLRCDASKLKAWQCDIGERNRPRIGIVWSGNPAHSNDVNRSISLERWIGSLPRDLNYYCLQKDVRAADETTLANNPWITRVIHGHHDFEDTAAMCECLDLVISVDTSVAHLSAALGRQTWIMLPFSADWRWLRERDDSPWYSTVRLYRQQSAGDWQEVFARLTRDLRQEFPGRAA